MQSTSDDVLIGRIATGDRLAMQVLFARHHVRVYRFVLRLVRDESVAEDLISEVFLDVWRQAGRFEGRSQVSTWLLAIARFKALSALRRRPDEELDEETAEAIEDPSDDPEVALDKKDKSAAIRKCLEWVHEAEKQDQVDRAKRYAATGQRLLTRLHKQSLAAQPAQVMCFTGPEGTSAKLEH